MFHAGHQRGSGARNYLQWVNQKIRKIYTSRHEEFHLNTIQPQRRIMVHPEPCKRTMAGLQNTMGACGQDEVATETNHTTQTDTFMTAMILDVLISHKNFSPYWQEPVLSFNWRLCTSRKQKEDSSFSYDHRETTGENVVRRKRNLLATIHFEMEALLLAQNISINNGISDQSKYLQILQICPVQHPMKHPAKRTCCRSCG